MKKSFMSGLVVGSFVAAAATCAVGAPKYGSNRTNTQPQPNNSAARSSTANSSATANSTKQADAAAAAAAAKKPALYSDDKSKMELSVPGDWKSLFSGPTPPGIIFQFHIPMDRESLKAIPVSKTAAPNEPIHVQPDFMNVDAAPVFDPKATLDSLVKDFKDGITHVDSSAVFKPAEKTKIAGLDGTALTITLAGKEKDEPKRIERHLLFMRDGNLFDVSLKAHANSFGKALAQFQTASRTVKFTAPAKKADELVKVYDNKEQSIRFTTYSALMSGVPCHDLACNGSFFAVVFPTDRNALPDAEPGKPTMIHSEAITFATAPAKAPTQTLDAAVEDLKAEVKAASPTAEFKPIEKTKLGDSDAIVLTATTDGEKADREPQRVQRRLVTLRNGKVFQVIHFSHVNAAEKQKPAFDSLVSSFEFTTPAAAVNAVATPAAATAPAAAPPAAAGKSGDGLD